MTSTPPPEQPLSRRELRERERAAEAAARADGGAAGSDSSVPVAPVTAATPIVPSGTAGIPAPPPPSATGAGVWAPGQTLPPPSAPAEVSDTCRVVRTKSCWPRSSSSRATIRVTEAGVRRSLRAAAAKLCCAATSRKTRIGFRSCIAVLLSRMQ